MINDYWKYSGPYSPWGPFDPDDSVNFTWDASDLVTAAGEALTMAGCDVAVDPRLKVLFKSIVGNLITVRIERDTVVPAVLGVPMKIRTRVLLSDGQHFDQTWTLVLLQS